LVKATEVIQANSQAMTDKVAPPYTVLDPEEVAVSILI
jgi:hypothetical protein